MNTFDNAGITPEAARKAAAQAAEAIRFLNNATSSTSTEALREPGDVDAILGDMETLVQRLPQLFTQLSQWMTAQCREGGVHVDWAALYFSSTAPLAVNALTGDLTEAAAMAEMLREVLHGARQITARLKSADGWGEEERSDG